MLTKEQLIRIQSSRGYEVEDLGRIVIFRRGRYSATWFFLADGTQDPVLDPQWHLDRSN